MKVLRFLIEISKVFLLSLPSFLLIIYILYPGLKSLSAVYSFKSSIKLQQSELNFSDKSVEDIDQSEVLRMVQLFFNKYDIAIDSQNIINTKKFISDHAINYDLIDCMKNSIVIFVPIKIRLPFAGFYIYEYCIVLK